mgnify:CR=1 FL=1
MILRRETLPAFAVIGMVLLALSQWSVAMAEESVPLLPLLVMLVSMQVFVSTLIFWVIIGFAFVSYVQSTLLRPVFRQLEAPDGPNVQLMD